MSKNPYNKEREPASWLWYESKPALEKKKYAQPRLYTEEEVMKILKYACGMQKADDYQLAGGILIGDSWAKDLRTEKLLNALADTDNNIHASLNIEEINEYLEEQ